MEAMEEVLVDSESSCLTSARPSSEQINAVVEFMQQHPDIASSKLRNGLSREKTKKLWEELTVIANGIPGSAKSTLGWMRFWVDKKGQVRSKKKMVDDNKHSCILTPAEEKIWNLCLSINDDEAPVMRAGKRKAVKKEIENNSDDEVLAKRCRSQRHSEANDQHSTDPEERQMNIMEELVRVMDRQATALSQLAQASTTNAQANEKLAEATITQARAAESLASTFANIGAAFVDVRNAIINIDYTLKRCYNINQT